MDQILLIGRNWCNDFTEMYSLTTVIYEKLFELNPSIRDVFDVPSSSKLQPGTPTTTRRRSMVVELWNAQRSKTPMLKKACRFQAPNRDQSLMRMSLKLVQTLDNAIRHLDEYETKVVPMLKQVGRHHVPFIARGLKTKYFDTMVLAAWYAISTYVREHQVSNDQDCEAIIEAWTIVLTDIILKTKYYFKQAAIAQGISMEESK